MLSIIIPAFNEEARLPGTLRELSRFLAAHAIAGEIIVVDDGSTDGTRSVVERAAAEGLPCRVHSFGRNRGKGAAVAEGIGLAGGSWALFVDSDLPVDLSDLLVFLDLMKGDSDILVGSKYCRGAVARSRPPLIRVLGSRGFRLVAQLLLRPAVSDTQFGFKAIRRSRADAILGRRRCDGFAFDAEMLVIARRLGLGVREVPVTWSYAPGTSLRAGVAISALGDLLAIWWRDLRGVYARGRDAAPDRLSSRS